jgi:hypothetical protein
MIDDYYDTRNTMITVKIKLPRALIDYINEIEVEKYRNVKDL